MRFGLLEKMHVCALPLLLVAFGAAGFAAGRATGGNTVEHHAKGTFEVKMTPQADAAVEGTARFGIAKVLYGDLEGTSVGEMYSAGDPRSGNAGYVALERVTGTLGGKKGSFVLQHFATMDSAGPHMQVVVTPGSGTDGLKGISGTFTIIIDGGKHSYDFEYSLPE